MGWADALIRTGIGIANQLTGPTSGNLQEAITWEAFIGQDGYGKASFATAVPLTAVVDRTAKQIQRGEHLVPVKATVLILTVVDPNGTVLDPPRREPFDPRDRITLMDGLTGPILDAPGSVDDPTTGRGYFAQIMIGDL